ncbi:MAG: chemotaxis protein CheX [Acidobacteriaceae bacterium]|nr:chemotaxis protein CheX [Acidobacteriaceae bacterium]
MERQQIIDAIHAATAEVFSTMLGLEIEPASVHTDQACPSVNDGVMAIVGIAGPWAGNGVISCTAPFACRVCELFLMTEAVAVNEEVLDAVGELANMVIGNFKTAAEAVVGPLGLSVPTVIYGRNFTSKSLGNNDWLVLPFKCAEDIFEVRVWFAPASESHPRHFVNHLQSV